MHTTQQEAPDANERAFIDQVIAGQDSRPGNLLGILQAVQNHNPATIFPWKHCAMLRRRPRLRPRRYSASPPFTRLFNLQPQGDNTICICRGTACHTRGSRELLESLLLELGLGQQDDLSGDRLEPTRWRSPLRTRSSRCAPSPVLGNARWLPSSKSTTTSAAT